MKNHCQSSTWNQRKRRRPPAYLPEAFQDGLHMDVSRILCRNPTRGSWAIISLGLPSPTTSCTPPVPSRGPRMPRRSGTRNCLRLHAVGFAVPRPSPDERCALTAPFHPCRPSRRGRRSVLCGTFPDPQPASRWALPTTVSCRVRTFLATRTRSPVHNRIVTIIFQLLNIPEK